MDIPHIHKDDNHPVERHKKELTMGQRAADIMTESMGSWWFIFFFSIILVIWIILNIIAWIENWDPYPFILLNLMLSMISAFQAPVIMMSQNRQTERDRIAAKYDYAVNRKVDREVQQIQKDLDEIKKILKATKKTKKT